MYDDIRYSQLVVEYQGEPKLTLNRRLLDSQDCWDNLETIKSLHRDRFRIEESLGVVNDIDQLNILTNKWTEVQYNLQTAWGFEMNSNFHRFWEIPACTCPSMDNMDRYPTKDYLISDNCKLHGREGYMSLVIDESSIGCTVTLRNGETTVIRDVQGGGDNTSFSVEGVDGGLWRLDGSYNMLAGAPSTLDIVSIERKTESGMETIDVIEAFDLNFNRGQVCKYLLRAGKKDSEIQDLKKCLWYLERELAKLEK